MRRIKILPNLEFKTKKRKRTSNLNTLIRNTFFNQKKIFKNTDSENQLNNFNF